MIGNRRENLEVGLGRCVLDTLPECHDTCNVPAAVAVIGCRPYCDHVLRGKVVFVALVHQLMSAGNERQIVDMIELETPSAQMDWQAGNVKANL